MNRRQLLELAATLSLPALATRHGLIAAADASLRSPVGAADWLALAKTSPQRRVRPSDPAWPSSADWERLREAVGGNLLKVRPPFGPCEEGSGSPCPEALQNLGNPFYLGDQPGGTQVSGWLDAWQPAPSAYAVAARNAADVIAAVNFAREHNLRVVIKGGGHSYQGTSNAPDSLLIWTRSMRGVVLHDAFVPKGCEDHFEPRPAVTLESGAMWIDAYDAVTTKAGRYVQGGGCTTVGVAGLVQSGGFGSFSKGFGTAAAGLLEADIVTADGRLRTVNACADPDLYWSLKGGGGGSWGVVTKITLRTHSLPAYFGGAQGKIQARSDTAFRRLVRQFLDFYSEHLFNPNWGEQIILHPDNTLKLSMNCQGLEDSQVTALWKPFFARVTADTELTVIEELYAGAGDSRHWWDVVARKRRRNNSMIEDPRTGAPETHAWWSGDSEQVGTLLYGYQSAWLPSSLLQPSSRARLAEGLFASSRHHEVELHFNKGLAGAPATALAAAADTATNPAVLEAFALAIIAEGGRPAYPGLPNATPDLPSARRTTASIAGAMDELRKVAPDAGSYVSESDYFERNWQRSHWGNHYPWLRAIKSKYDPDGLFFVHHGVGSEDWSSDGFTRLVVHSPRWACAIEESSLAPPRRYG